MDCSQLSDKEVFNLGCVSDCMTACLSVFLLMTHSRFKRPRLMHSYKFMTEIRDQV